LLLGLIHVQGCGEREINSTSNNTYIM
jgi:hypothetical protein